MQIAFQLTELFQIEIDAVSSTEVIRTQWQNFLQDPRILGIFHTIPFIP